jgi:hypothetical protein
MTGNQPNFEFGIFSNKIEKSKTIGKCLNRFLLLHLKYKNESENGKVGQENTDSIGLNTENDAVRFGIFPFRFHP